MTAEHEPSMGALLNVGTFVTAQVACLWNQSWNSLCFNKSTSSAHMFWASHKCLLLALEDVWISAHFLAQVLKNSSVLQYRKLWDYSIRKLCKFWEAGLVACGKHSGRFLDSLVPRQTDSKVLTGPLNFSWRTEPPAEGVQALRLWLALALCLAMCMWVICNRIIIVVLSLFTLLLLLRRKALQGNSRVAISPDRL